MTLFDVNGDPEFEWTPFHEVHLIYAMGGVRFLGINKHFNLSQIMESFYTGVGNASGITWEEIVKKIKTYYNLNFEKRVFNDVFPVEDFNLDSTLLSEFPSKEAEVFTDESSMGSKSESESLSNSGGESSTTKRGKTSTKKEPISRRSTAAASSSGTPKKSDVKSKEETSKKPSAAKKRAGGSLKEPAAKKMKTKD